MRGDAFCDHCGARRQDGPVADDHERCVAARVLEPPRYCPSCSRRMVVQVTPLGWTARCAAHGQRRSQ